jgi:vacuolar-type H+-ATPase subunit E/Vma4
MSLESLVDEIRARGEAELRAVAERRTKELAAIAADLDGRVAALRAGASRATEAEAARERAQRLAAAHLAARRQEYGAREERLASGFEATRRMLSDLTEGARYSGILKRMIASAADRLGRSVRISGRSNDADLLERLAGRAYDPTPRPILGGIVAETPDGRRRLDFSFDELLRERADAVRGLLA